VNNNYISARVVHHGRHAYDPRALGGAGVRVLHAVPGLQSVLQRGCPPLRSHGRLPRRRRQDGLARISVRVHVRARRYVRGRSDYHSAISAVTEMTDEFRLFRYILNK
jgi:hypothetical protein